ncbi:hypothetical protein Taro_002087 [Colocasia esculenta]|uniref:Uncharacterized protein n=1 Tax=Colocasia esculenta TaxID=4460 RepID=A0A843TJV1_COLES|nr:hypothetical protein [Colocasia esculenta]
MDMEEVCSSSSSLSSFSSHNQVKCRMWTFRVAVILGGRGVDANLRILQVLKGGWTIVERVALLNCARKRRGVVQFPSELTEGSNRFRVPAGFEAEELGVNIVCRQAHQPGCRRPDSLPKRIRIKYVIGLTGLAEVFRHTAPKDSFELTLPSMPVFHLPPSELPIYRRYNEIFGWAALEWFYSLEPADTEDFEAIKADEDFMHYADRWRALAETLRDPLSKSEQVKMITANATPQFRHILAMNKLSTLEELYEGARYIQTHLKDSPIMAMFESKARTFKKTNGAPPTGGPTTEGVMQNE